MDRAVPDLAEWNRATAGPCQRDRMSHVRQELRDAGDRNGGVHFQADRAVNHHVRNTFAQRPERRALSLLAGQIAVAHFACPLRPPPACARANAAMGQPALALYRDSRLLRRMQRHAGFERPMLVDRIDGPDGLQPFELKHRRGGNHRCGAAAAQRDGHASLYAPTHDVRRCGRRPRAGHADDWPTTCCRQVVAIAGHLGRRTQ